MSQSQAIVRLFRGLAATLLLTVFSRQFGPCRRQTLAGDQVGGLQQKNRQPGG
jgi:hypothetical protein